MAEGRFEWRGSAITIAGWCFPLNGLGEITGEHHHTELETQVSDQEEQGNTDGPPLGALVVDVDVRDSKVGARLVGCPAELASNHHVLNGPRGQPERARDLDRRARELTRESIFVQENSAMVLGDRLEVLLQGTVSDEARTLLNDDHMPRPIGVRSQQARMRTSCRSRIPREDLELVSLTPVALVRAEGGSSTSTRRLFQEFMSRFPICCQSVAG